MGIRLLFLLLLCLFPAHASASLGFGTTSGSGTTDALAATVTWPSSFSFSMWFYGNSFTNVTAPRLFDHAVTGGSHNLQFATSGTLMNLSIGFTTTAGSWTIAAPSTGAWHNVAVVYDGTSTANNPTIYLDCTSVSVTRATGPSGSIRTGSATLTIGNRNTADRNFDGRIAEFAFWSSVLLTSNQVGALCKGITPLRVRRSSLTFYFPMRGTSSGVSDWGPNHLSVTVTGTANKNHAPVQTFPHQAVAP